MRHQHALFSRGSAGLLDTFASKTIYILLMLLALSLTACDKVSNDDSPPDPVTRTSTAADPEVGYFSETFYLNIMGLNCRNCHTRGGIGTGAFADDNVNTAFAATTTWLEADVGDVIGTTAFKAAVTQESEEIPDRLQNPSRFVSKVASDHNCWSGNCANDAATMATWLGDWSDAVAGNADGTFEDDLTDDPATTDLTLIDPDISEVTSRKAFDKARDYPSLFAPLYAVLTDNGTGGRCGACHSSTSNTPQTPYFADASDEAAYDAIVASGVVDLNVLSTTPITDAANSRVVFRVGAQTHNCWTVCADNASTIMNAINGWSTNPSVAVAAFDPTPYNLSKALNIDDGQVTSGGARVNRYVIAKYEFKEGADSDPSNDSVARDSSGVPPAVDLTLFGNVSWIRSYGVRIGDGGLVRSTSINATKKLHDLILARGEYSIEAWVLPENLTQQGDGFESAPIVSYSIGEVNRNFTMAQYVDHYRFYNRIDQATATPFIRTEDSTLQSSLQHVVMTFTEADGRRIYVNGELMATGADTATRDNLVQWDLGHLLTVGADTDGSNQWLGDVKFLAIHRAALDQAAITQNYEAGVGQKFNLLFSLNDIMPDPGVFTPPAQRPNYYMWFQVSEHDDYSYLFATPQFITLHPGSGVNFTFSGMRIGMNGKEVEVGQSFDNYGKPTPLTVNTTATGTGTPGGAVDLATLAPGLVSGTVFAQERGRLYDQFFLTFENFNGQADAVSRGAGIVPTPQLDYAVGATSTSGMRTFAELNATMSEVTGVSKTVVQADYDNLKAQMPANEGVSAFGSSTQMAIANLAGIYCGNLVDGNGSIAPATYFGVNASVFSTDGVNTVFPGGNTANRDAIVAALKTRMVGANIGNQPADASIDTALNTLHSGLVGSCDAGVNPDCTGNIRVKTIVKAMCMSVLGSAAVTMQ